jgi:predicted DNA-binding transcriptional regulator AlpA
MNQKKNKNDLPGEGLISQAKAAEMCGMTRAAIYELVSRGKFRTLTIEGQNLVYRTEVEEFEKARSLSSIPN